MTRQIKRSEVNRIMREADKFIRSFGYILPPFAYWTPKEFQERKGKVKKITGVKLVWDITDYGLNEFDIIGLLLFTVRNGDANDLTKGRGMLYAGKGDDFPQRAVPPDASAQRQGRRYFQPRRRHASGRALRRHQQGRRNPNGL